MADSEPHLMSFAGQAAHRNGDLSIWTSLLSRGDAVCLADPLSSFRQHASQVQKDGGFRTEAMKAWVMLKEAATATGLLSRFNLLEHDLQPLVAAGDLQAGENLFQAGSVAEAAAIFAALVREEPQHALARGNLACALWQSGAAREALLEATLACCVDPEAETLALNLQDMLAVVSG